MKPQSGDRLYSPLVRSYRPKVSRTQIALLLTALAVSAAAVYAHYRLVVQPSQAGLALASPVYQPWYLAEPLPASRSGANEATVDNPAGRSAVATRDAGRQSGPARWNSPGAPRPNIVPQPGVGYSAVDLKRRIGTFAGSQTGSFLKPGLAAKAQELAESYASSATAGMSTFPLPAALERSVLEQGWLWDLREGCAAELYFKFPAGRLDAMGCDLAAVPQGKPFGVGVIWIERPGTGQKPVIVVVWENK